MSATSKRTSTTTGETASKRKPARQDCPTGEIRPGCLLTADEARRRLGLGTWAWRSLRRQGLLTVRVAGRAYVMSDAIIKFFGEQAEKDQP